MFIKILAVRKNEEVLSHIINTQFIVCLAVSKNFGKTQITLCSSEEGLSDTLYTDLTVDQLWDTIKAYNVVHDLTGDTDAK